MGIRTGCFHGEIILIRLERVIMEDVKNLTAMGCNRGIALLVEDNEINAAIVKNQLVNFGFEVEWVANGARAVEYFGDSKEGHYSIVVMDLMMPVMDGIEATRIIRKLSRNDAKTVPIIAVTANTYQEDRKACEESGITGFITKPYMINQLKEVIDNLTEIA